MDMEIDRNSEDSLRSKSKLSIKESEGDDMEDTDKKDKQENNIVPKSKFK